MTTLAPIVITTTLNLEAANDAENFEAATTVAQIFSGIVFAGLGVWMLVSNGTKMSYIQRASLEKRMGTCCAIDTYVALFSAFFNFFQLTEVDDLFLPRDTNFTLDFSRPVEWIVTCPMMQVVLVLMGGSRIPEYRRVLMPSLSLAVLCCGTASMLIGSAIRFAFYGVGFCIAMGMFFLNAKQVIEHSNGEENLWVGDSEFRKASLLLIVTWFPFPIWFFCSPEGVGLIDNILIIQMGWAFLNILSKFTFIFYIQRVKDNYCNRLKVKRELLGNGGGAHDPQLDAIAGMMGLNNNNPMAGGNGKSKEKELAAVVIETMTFLGMAQHNDRFLKLLREAKVTSVPQVEVLTEEETHTLKLPWDLVSALQKRIKVWRLEMTDNAELELEKGEAHYQAHTPTGADAQKFEGLVPGAVPEDGSQPDLRGAIQRALMGAATPIGGGDQEFQQQMSSQLAQVGDMVNMLQQQVEQVNAGMMRRQSELEQGIQWQLEQLRQGGNGGMGGGKGGSMDSDRIEQLMAQQQDRHEQAIDALGRAVMTKLDSLHASQQRQQAENESGFLQKIGQMVQKQSEQGVDSMTNAMAAKMDMGQAAHMRQQSEVSDNMLRNMENIINKAMSNGNRMGGSTGGGMDFGGMDQVQRQIDSVLQKALERADTNGEVLSLKLDKMEGNLLQTFGSISMPSGARSPRQTSESAELERTLQNRVEDLQSAQLRQLEDNMRRKFEDVVDQAISRFEMTVQGIRSSVQGDVSALARGNDIVAETVRTTSDTQMEGLADLRRVNMMVLEQSSAALEKAGSGMGKMDVLQGTVDTGFGRLLERMGDLSMGGDGPGNYGGRPSSTRSPSAQHAQWPTQGGSNEGSRRPSAANSAQNDSLRPSLSSKYGMQVING